MPTQRFTHNIAVPKMEGITTKSKFTGPVTVMLVQKNTNIDALDTNIAIKESHNHGWIGKRRATFHYFFYSTVIALQWYSVIAPQVTR